MSQIVVSIKALEELRNAFKIFKTEEQEILQSIEWEIIHAEQSLHDEINHWRHQEEVCQEEVFDAERALERCRDDDDWSCDDEEEALFQAKSNLKHARDELQDNRKKLRSLEGVAEDYRRQVSRLIMLMDNDLQRGDQFLDSAITNLHDYVGVNESSGAFIGNIGSNLRHEAGPSQLSFVEKNQIIENLPEPEGLPYSDKMKKCLLGLCYLDNYDFQVMSKYLNSKEHRPAIFDNQAMAEKVYKRDFPDSAEREGGWNKDWSGIHIFYPDKSSCFAIPKLPHRAIIADYDEYTLIHELGHQLYDVVWTENLTGESKRMKVKELYANLETGKVKPVMECIDCAEEYFAYSFEWFFQQPAYFKIYDPAMFEFLNTQVLNGMNYELQ